MSDKKYLDKEGLTYYDGKIKQYIDNVDNKLNKSVLQNETFSFSGDNVTNNKTFINIKTGETTTSQEVLGLADSTNAGMMSPTSVVGIQQLRTDVDLLKGQSIRLVYDVKENPTQSEIQQFVTNAGYPQTDWPNIGVVVKATNHIWRYFNNNGWTDIGVDTVNQFTNLIAGIIKGSEEDGQVYAEDDGTGSVVGWDDLKEEVNNKQPINDNNLQTISKTVVGAINEINSRTVNLTNIENGSGQTSIQMKQDGSTGTFDFTNKNPKATQLDPTLTGQLTYGAIGNFSTSLGGKGQASGKRSFQEGTTTIAKGAYSHAEGDNSVALGGDSHAEGYATTSYGQASHSEGNETVAKGLYSHAEGTGSIAEGLAAHAEGASCHANGDFSFAGGHGSYANEEGSFTFGEYTIANNEYATVFGKYTASNRDGQFVIGQFNKPNDQALFIIGNGNSGSSRSNAFEVLADGRAKVYGIPTEANDVVRKQELDTKITNPSNGSDGQFLKKTSSGEEWADISSGVTDYNDLTNKPSINNITLQGNKTSKDLGIVSNLIDGAAFDSLKQKDVSYTDLQAYIRPYDVAYLQQYLPTIGVPAAVAELVADNDVEGLVAAGIPRANAEQLCAQGSVVAILAGLGITSDLTNIVTGMAGVVFGANNRVGAESIQSAEDLYKGIASAAFGKDNINEGKCSLVVGQGLSNTGDNSLSIGSKSTFIVSTFPDIEKPNARQFLINLQDAGIISTGKTLEQIKQGQADSFVVYLGNLNGNDSFILGHGNSEGSNNISTGSSFVKGSNSFAFGNQNVINANNAFTSGLLNYTYSSAQGAITFGENNKSTGRDSLTIGDSNITRGVSSFTAGYKNENNGNQSFVSGLGLINNRDYATVLGRYNSLTSNALFTIGNGTDSNNRKDIFSIFDNGHISLMDVNPTTGGSVFTIAPSGKLTYSSNGINTSSLELRFHTERATQRAIDLPAKSGTVALTSDIPTDTITQLQTTIQQLQDTITSLTDRITYLENNVLVNGGNN